MKKIKRYILSMLDIEQLFMNKLFYFVTNNANFSIMINKTELFELKSPIVRSMDRVIPAFAGQTLRV